MNCIGSEVAAISKVTEGIQGRLCRLSELSSNSGAVAFEIKLMSNYTLVHSPPHLEPNTDNLGLGPGNIA